MKKLGCMLLAGLLVASMAACTATPGNSSQGNQTFTYADTIAWDAEYDVVVAGFGASGAVTAKTASEEGASVLIVEKMSEGEAGGNSKVAGQLFAYGGGNYEKTLTYYKNLAAGTEVPEDMIETIAKGVTNMADTLANDFGFNKDEFMNWTGIPVIGVMSPEYPEFEGSDVVGLWTTHAGVSDSYFYQTLKKNVTDRSDKIDVWFESPAIELIQDPQSKVIIGVKVERGGKTMNVRAINGVVLCTGGFEANKQMVQDYLGLTEYAVIGGLYNTGDGQRMAQSVGADLWHMSVYEGGFGLGGTSFKVEEGEHAVQIQVLTQGPLNTGSLILVGTDGDRFLNESAPVRHGHMYANGVWANPTYPEHMWTVYDETKANELKETNSIPERFQGQVIEANSIAELAEKTGMKKEQLEATINNYNNYAKTGVDEQYHRDAAAMSAFTGSKYYAFPVIPEILNTQGGPRRNANAEILDVHGNPIPHLYSAGEMGGITSEMYQGGTNLAECVIFGQIAGKNAAKAKDALPNYVAPTVVESKPTKLGEVTDLNKTVDVETKENEYVGSAAGMGGTLTVKVTMDGDKIANIEIVSQSETPDIAKAALETIPQAIIDAQSTEVDTVAKATVTSKAIIEAVNDALSKRK